MSEQVYDENKRRLARLEVSPSIILDLCTETEWPRVVQVTKDALPAGTKLVGANYDAIRDVWCLGLQHDSFEVVSYGEEAPLLPPVEITSSLGAYQRLVTDREAHDALLRQVTAALGGLLDEHVEDYGDNPDFASLNEAVKTARTALAAAKEAGVNV